jgi:uncharacterized protein YerC
MTISFEFAMLGAEMNSSLKRQLLRTFSQMLDDLKDRKEIENFLTDFFDDGELEKYVKRISIIYWLKKGRDKENIKRNLLATSKEISLAEKLLKKDGVKLAIKKIEAEEFANQWVEKIQKFRKK